MLSEDDSIEIRKEFEKVFTCPFSSKWIDETIKGIIDKRNLNSKLCDDDFVCLKSDYYHVVYRVRDIIGDIVWITKVFNGWLVNGGFHIEDLRRANAADWERNVGEMKFTATYFVKYGILRLYMNNELFSSSLGTNEKDMRDFCKYFEIPIKLCIK